MRPHTDRFTAEILRPHSLALLVELLYDDVVVGDPLQTITGGTVTLDTKAQARGRAELTLVDDGTLGLVPNTPTDRLAPYGREAWVRRGVRYEDGSSELISLGKFRINDTDIDSVAGGLSIAISGLDRSARISDAKFEEPYQIAQGTNGAEAILTLLRAVYPTVQTRFAATDLTTPRLTADENSDRWKMAQDIATAIGMRLYFDGDGVAVLTPEMIGDAVATIAEVPAGSSEPGALLSAGRGWTRQGAFNAVVATGENTGEAAAARGVARDLDPLSPTYFYGPFGQITLPYQSQFIRTDEQAADAAQTILNRELGTTQTVRFGSLVLPHLEPGDAVQITRLVAGIDELNVLDSLTIPLTADGVMTGATRVRTVQS